MYTTPDDPSSKKWCEEDSHWKYDFFKEFNEWLDAGEDPDSIEIIDDFNLGGFPCPSKTLFAGDYEGYEMSFKRFQSRLKADAFCKDYINEFLGDDHWYNRNLSRFEDFVRKVTDGTIVPFIGAGISKNAGYPTWKEHLAEQGKTAGIVEKEILQFIESGKYEELIQKIESVRNKETFTQEIRDTFSVLKSYPDSLILMVKLFRDTFITTNYDKLIELACDDITGREVQLISKENHEEQVSPDKVTVFKIHGDVFNQRGCILSKEQYDSAYGSGNVDLSLPVPSLLKYYYLSSNLLFLGCSLNNDRTVDVFRRIKESVTPETMLPQHYSIEQLPSSKEELESRNSYLAEMGISGIWFEPKRFECIEQILRLVSIEINYQEGSKSIKDSEEKSSLASQIKNQVFHVHNGDLYTGENKVSFQQGDNGTVKVVNGNGLDSFPPRKTSPEGISVSSIVNNFVKKSPFVFSMFVLSLLVIVPYLFGYLDGENLKEVGNFIHKIFEINGSNK